MINNDLKMFQVSASAPGKVIISGEHAVVYGSKAIALSINLRTTCNIKLLQNNERTLIIQIEERKISLDLWELLIKKNLSESLFELVIKIKDSFDNSQSNNDIKTFDLFNILSPYLNISKNDVFIITMILLVVHTFLYKIPNSLESLISFLNKCTLIITVESDIPQGAGLGSSAAYTTSFTGGLLVMEKLNRL